MVAIGAAELIIILIVVAFLATRSKKNMGTTMWVLVGCFTVVAVGVGVSYLSLSKVVVEHSSSPVVENSSLIPQIEIGELPKPEVDEEWADSIEISHAEIDLSTIPEGHPEWVDQTEGKWSPEKEIWSTTVMIGPYETEDECEENFHKHIREAAVEFAEWRAAQLTDVGYYDPDKLPLPEADLNFNHGKRSRSSGDEAYELRTFKRGSVYQTYHTKSNTGVSDEPWPVVFARVLLDTDFQRKVDRHLLHERSVGRALRAGTVWGVALLGMVLALGGLKWTESGSQADALETLAVASSSEAPSVSLPLAKSKDFARKRWGLLMAPLICTAIFFMTSGLPRNPHEFWPMWVWFGCGIGFISTCKPFRCTKPKKRTL